jgi:signal transduction histidine kinase
MQLTAETLALRDPPAERRQTLVQRLLADLERLGGLVSNLLEASRLQQATLPSNPERLDLHAVAAQAVDEWIGRADQAGIEIVIEVPQGLEIEADPVGVRTVLRNLLGNALEASRLAGGERLELVGEHDDDRIRLRVRDDGVGFPPEEAQRLFEQFYRVGDEMRRKSPGTGLGLYIVRRFMDLERGRVWAESPGQGQGATLTVEWPRPQKEEPTKEERA